MKARKLSFFDKAGNVLIEKNEILSDLGARCRNFRHIVTELATTAAVEANNHLGSQVGRKRRYRYLQNIYRYLQLGCCVVI